MDFRLTNVEALWPKLDRAYKFDAAQNRSVPCDATDPDGSYELHIVVTEDQAKELAGKMRTAFNESEKVKGKTWDVKSLDDIPAFTRDEGAWRIKTSKKTYSDKDSKPRQFMQDGTKAADDFQLTTGSKIHVMLRIAPWAYAGKVGVSLRPEGVMVVDLAERKDPPADTMFGDLVQNDSPFADLTPSAPKPADDDPFGLPDVPEKAPASNDLDDEIPF